MKKTVILGGFGFIGKNLAKKCKLPVHLASRRTGVDLFDLAKTKEYLGQVNPEVIYNCSAHSGGINYVGRFCGDILRENVQMSLNLYEAVKEVCPKAVIVNPLSNCSYPGASNIHKESEWLSGPVHPSISAYGNAKRILYFISENYRKQFGLQTKNFLVPNAFGPDDYFDSERVHALNGMILRMLQAKKEGAPTFEIWGTGKPVREWGYSKDIADILLLSQDLDADLSEPVNIAQNCGISIRESAETIAQLIDYRGKLVFNTQYQDGAPIKVLDNARFKALFPAYRFTDHTQALQETIAYYQS